MLPCTVIAVDDRVVMLMLPNGKIQRFPRSDFGPRVEKLDIIEVELLSVDLETKAVQVRPVPKAAVGSNA